MTLNQLIGTLRKQKVVLERRYEETEHRHLKDGGVPLAPGAADVSGTVTIVPDDGSPPIVLVIK